MSVSRGDSHGNIDVCGMSGGAGGARITTSIGGGIIKGDGRTVGGWDDGGGNGTNGDDGTNGSDGGGQVVEGTLVAAESITLTVGKVPKAMEEVGLLVFDQMDCLVKERSEKTFGDRFQI